MSELRIQVRKFLDEKLEPIVDGLNERGEFPEKIFREYFRAGFGTSYFPEEWGGNGNLIEFLELAEELGKTDMGFALSALASSILFGNNVLRHGSEAQKKEYLVPLANGSKIGSWALTEPEGGSDAIGIKTIAEKSGDHYILNGSKTFITNAPVCELFIVISRLKGTEPGSFKGGCAFILERGQIGLNTGKALKKMGHTTSPTGEMFLENCKVHKSQLLGKEGFAFLDMKSSLDIERASFSAIGLGLVDKLLRMMTRYSFERKQFGKPIAEYQLIQDKIAKVASQYDLLRVYSKYLIEKVVKGESITKEAAILKLELSRLAVRAADETIQVMGGYGYMTEYRAERYYRDAKLYEIGGGTSEIQKLIIAKETFKEFHS